MFNANIFKESDIIKNEISFTNLIQIANNNYVFSALDNETRKKLIQILSAYTKASIDRIMESAYSSSGAVRNQDQFDIQRKM